MKRDLLVGSTGFVGSNLAKAHPFSLQVHSSNIENAFANAFDLAIYAGVPGTKFIANLDPKSDRKIIEQAKENIDRIEAKKLVLISTTDVYGKKKGLCETDIPLSEGLDAYGLNRLHLEQWIQKKHSDALIVRLPAIYGENLKKNFIYDLIHRSPVFLSSSKYEEMKDMNPLIEKNYRLDSSGFWKNQRLEQAEELDRWFESQPFNALNFTDSRSVFQFYDLSRLWEHITLALTNDFNVLNIAPPPLSAQSVYEHIYGIKWENKLDKPLFDYDMRSCLLTDSGQKKGYIERPEDELAQLKHFVLEQKHA